MRDLFKTPHLFTQVNNMADGHINVAEAHFQDFETDIKYRNYPLVRFSLTDIDRTVKQVKAEMRNFYNVNAANPGIVTENTEQLRLHIVRGLDDHLERIILDDNRRFLDYSDELGAMNYFELVPV